MKPLALNRRVETRVGTLAVADHGTGTPVVLWPSLGSDHQLFDPVVQQLGAGWRTLRVDGPGFGRSAPPRGEVQPERYADAVVELLDALGIGRALVAGCSWGGRVAAHLGVRAPERVSGVLMMNTPLAPSRGGHAFQVLGTRWLGATAFWGRGVARAMFARDTRTDHPERVEAFVSAFASFDPAASAVTMRTVLTRFAGLGEVLPRLRVPTTLLLGGADRLYPVERMLPLARLAPGATIQVLPGCGHLAPLEAPEAVVAALHALAHASPRGGVPEQRGAPA